jgi:hypothetical protein
MRGATLPCFLWPAVDAGDGLLKLPISSEENAIESFSPIKEIAKSNIRINGIDANYEKIVLQAGKDTRFAYAFSHDDYKIGTIKEIKRFVDGRKEIDALNIYKKYELFCAIKDNKFVCNFLENIVRKDNSQYSYQEKKWAEYELNYLRKNQKASIPSDVWVDHIKRTFADIKQVLEGSMSIDDAVGEFSRFARQYTTDSSKMGRSMREIIELMLKNDSLRKENEDLKSQLEINPADWWMDYMPMIDQKRTALNAGCFVGRVKGSPWFSTESYYIGGIAVQEPGYLGSYNPSQKPFAVFEHAFRRKQSLGITIVSTKEGKEKWIEMT